MAEPAGASQLRQRLNNASNLQDYGKIAVWSKGLDKRRLRTEIIFGEDNSRKTLHTGRSGSDWINRIGYSGIEVWRTEWKAARGYLRREEAGNKLVHEKKGKKDHRDCSIACE